MYSWNFPDVDSDAEHLFSREKTVLFLKNETRATAFMLIGWGAPARDRVHINFGGTIIDEHRDSLGAEDLILTAPAPLRIVTKYYDAWIGWIYWI